MLADMALPDSQQLRFGEVNVRAIKLRMPGARGVESGDAEPGDNTGSVVRQPAVASTLESTPEAPSKVKVHADSHGVKFDFDQRSPDDTSGVARPALDFNTVFRSL